MTKVSENTLTCTICHSIIKGSVLVGDIACLKIILSSCRCAHTFAAEEDIVGEEETCGGRGGPTDRVGQCISENVSLILMPSVAPLPLCRGERDRRRKEISPLQRQSGRRQERGRINQPQSGLW